MAIVEKITGFPINNRGRLYCADYKLDPAVIVSDTYFSTGKGVEANKLPPGTVLCDFNVFGRGELSGHYILRLHWTTTNFALNDLDLVVYEDGTALPPVHLYRDYDTFFEGSNVSNILCIFNPESEYRIELVAGEYSEMSRVSLDYIQFDRVPSHAILTSVDTKYGVGGVSMDLLEKQTLTITGDNTPSKSETVTFLRTYHETPSVQVTSSSSYLNVSVGNHTPSNALITLRHIYKENWSFSINVTVWVWGNVTGNEFLRRSVIF